MFCSLVFWLVVLIEVVETLFWYGSYGLKNESYGFMFELKGLDDEHYEPLNLVITDYVFLNQMMLNWSSFILCIDQRMKFGSTLVQPTFNTLWCLVCGLSGWLAYANSYFSFVILFWTSLLVSYGCDIVLVIFLFLCVFKLN